MSDKVSEYRSGRMADKMSEYEYTSDRMSEKRSGGR